MYFSSKYVPLTEDPLLLTELFISTSTAAYKQFTYSANLVHTALMNEISLTQVLVKHAVLSH